MVEVSANSDDAGLNGISNEIKTAAEMPLDIIGSAKTSLDAECVSVLGYQNVFLFYFMLQGFSDKEIGYALDEKLYFNKEVFSGKHYYIPQKRGLSSESSDLHDTISKSLLLEINRIFLSYAMIEEEIETTNQVVSLENNGLYFPLIGNTDIYYGSVRSGQEIKTDKNCIILGDINKGAYLYAGGSVITTGVIRGHVYAGVGSNTKAIVKAVGFKDGLICVAETVYDTSLAKSDVNGSQENYSLMCFIGDRLFLA